MRNQRLMSTGIVVWTFWFWANHFGTISFCMLFAAGGRATQMRFFGPIPPGISIGLEVVVEVARILTLLVIFGHGRVAIGIQKTIQIFHFKRQEWSELGRKIRGTVSQQWPVLLWNLLIFSLIAYGFNQINGFIADHSEVLIFLKKYGFMHESSSAVPIVFFLKNLTVIPFTLVFDYALVRWLSGSLRVNDVNIQAAI